MERKRMETRAAEEEFAGRAASWGVVCPVCRGALAQSAAEAIHCDECGRVYPVRDGLPVLIAAEATQQQE